MHRSGTGVRWDRMANTSQSPPNALKMIALTGDTAPGVRQKL